MLKTALRILVVISLWGHYTDAFETCERSKPFLGGIRTSKRQLRLHEMTGDQMILTEVIKGIVSYGMIAIYINTIQSAADKRFSDSQNAVEKRFSDSQNAADKRFTDVISSLKDVRTLERERTVAEMKCLETKVVSLNQTKT